MKCRCKHCSYEPADEKKNDKNHWNDTSDISHSDFLHLMDIYLQEWVSRIANSWRELFVYFFATLIVIIMPFQPFDIVLPDKMPKILFPIVGTVMSIVFFFVARSQAARLQCVSKAYAELIDMLPEELRRQRIKDLGNGLRYRLFDRPISGVLASVMFFLLFGLGVYLTVFIAIYGAA